jgi:hypothetical protein
MLPSICSVFHKSFQGNALRTRDNIPGERGVESLHHRPESLLMHRDAELDDFHYPQRPILVALMFNPAVVAFRNLIKLFSLAFTLLFSPDVTN